MINDDSLYAFKTKADEARVYGINGCLCKDCVNKRLIREWHRIQGTEQFQNFKDFIQHAKEEIKIIDLAIKKYGIDVYQKQCCCPFHEDDNPSLTFYEKTNTFYCFGCGASGDVIEFIERMENKKKTEVNTPRLVITPQLRYFILKRQNYICNKCGTRLKFSKKHGIGDEVAHIDHIHPYSKRDTYINGAERINEYSNLQGLCQTCSLRKYNRDN